MPTVDQALTSRQRLPVFLLAIDALRRLPHWTLAPGKTYTWQTPMTEEVIGAFEDGTALTERASIALVEANAASYYHDWAAGVLYVRPSTGSPYSHTFTAAFQIRAGTVGKREIDSKPWPRRLVAAPGFTRAADRNFGQMPGATSGSLRLDNADGTLDVLNDPLVVVYNASAIMGVDL